MSKRQFKAQASSSRVASGTGFGGFGFAGSGSTLSYLTEPPNLSSVSDANVVVAFKNLSKKDGTTKSKALEDLRGYVQAHPFEQNGGVEEPMLDVWVKFYPRLSIDNSRRVRELSHILQYELLKSARKRMEKHIPKIVGSWLAGTFDRDRTVARAAKDGVASFLDTGEKLALFWKRCQAQILEFAQEAINETPRTLSDERTMNADDMEAKYFRVVGSSLSLVLHLLETLSEEDIIKNQDGYNVFLSNNKKIWALAACGDGFVRRTTAKLLAVCLEKQSNVIENDLDLISHAFIAEALPKSQSASAFQLLQALLALTIKHPEVWNSRYTSKKGPISRLRIFVVKGSQGGPPEYWQILRSLFSIIPVDVIPADLESCSNFLNAVRGGISSREEPRNHAAVAWSSYFEITHLLGQKLSGSACITKLFQESVYPVFEQYLHPIVENSGWPTGLLISSVAQAYKLCASAVDEEHSKSFSAEWQRLGDNFVSRLQTSLPEQSKDYHKSQMAIIGESSRWFRLLADIMLLDESAVFSAPMTLPSSKIISTASTVMLNRNGKPYSSAATLETALRLTPAIFVENSSKGAVELFLQTQLSTLLVSPSSKYLVSILSLFRNLPGEADLCTNVWSKAIEGLLPLPEESAKSESIAALISIDGVSDLAQSNPRLQDYLFDGSIAAIRGDPIAWQLLVSILTYGSLTEQKNDRLIEEILASLDLIGSNLDGALNALEVISTKRKDMLKNHDIHVVLVTKLLALTELSDSALANRATRLRSVLESTDKAASSESSQQALMLHVIKGNLETATQQSLAIETLIAQAKLVMVDSNDAAVDSSLFPDTIQWHAALYPYIQQTPDYALAVMRPFAGAVFLVSHESAKDLPRAAKDMNGYSIALRMAMYTAGLVAESAFLSLPLDNQVELLYLLFVTAEITRDQVDLLEEQKLFESQLDSDIMIEIREFLTQSQICLAPIIKSAKSWRRDSKILDNASEVVRKLVSKLLVSSAGKIFMSYYASKSLSRVLSAVVDAHGWQNEGGDEWLTSLKILKSSTTNVLGVMAILIGLEENLGMSKVVNNLCNRLISDIAGASIQSDKTFELLLMLNANLAVYEEGDLPVAQNRLIFAVKQILSWTENFATTNPRLRSEACRSLQRLLPAIKGVYGAYWETSLKFCVSIWTSCENAKLSNDHIPEVGMSLKLYSVLRKLEDANDDLEDAFVEMDESISQGLFGLLKLRRTVNNHPLEYVDDLLLRLVTNISLKPTTDLSEFYPLIASEFLKVQYAAFDVLHRALPEAQKQISVDVLVEKRDATLPEELLSLLLDAPSHSDFSDEGLDTFPSSIRGYLLSWHLVFDSFTAASHKVRMDYSDVLKSENYITPLMTFIFDILGHSDAKPLNLDKVRIDSDMIRKYDMVEAINRETAEKNMQWLLVNIYYLALKCMPNLIKNWWVDTKSKQTRIAVESWTEKYFSPLVIQDTLEEIATWSEELEAPGDDEKELIVKVSKRSREVYAGFEIDDTTMQIAIRLPAAYPLESVKVDGVNRVAASEKKWNSWLMSTQGAITFSNGSIADGLSTFRRNVTGTLKGQTECAICYSIISPDKKMPDKRCQTCKNLFHSNCLFKWFASSNQSTCPLCRNPFNYGSDRSGRRQV